MVPNLIKYSSKYCIIAIIIICSLAGIINNASGSTATGNMQVTANVTATCSVTANNLAFGNYAGALIQQPTTVNVTCTNGTTYSVGMGNGNGVGATAAARKLTNSGNSSVTLTYSIYTDSGYSNVWSTSTVVNGTGTGTSQSITAYGQIPASQTPTAGSYTDVVVVTITF